MDPDSSSSDRSDDEEEKCQLCGESFEEYFGNAKTTNPCGCVLHEYCQEKFGQTSR